MTRGRAWLTGIGILILAGIVVAAAILFWPAPPARAVAAPAATPVLIARGRYVAIEADCVACHTTEGGQPFAGGRAFRLPFGTIYSPNITSDRETGIGSWSDGEFLRALHHGVGKGGEELYPAFPYTSYAGMSDEDALALKAYLFSLPPVRSRVEANGLRFPFNQRPIMRFWKILFMPRGGFRPDPGRPAELNRGAYLVQVMGHCGECHTPRNLLYGLERSRALSGEFMQGWTAYNITSDTTHGIGAWRPDEIRSYLASGYAAGRGVAGGPMLEAIHYSLSQLTPQDQQAIVAYLQTVRPSARGPAIDPDPSPLAHSSLVGPAASDADTEGRRIFEGACASCHAWNGQGQQTQIAALRRLASVNDPEGHNVVQTILRGATVSADGEHVTMPSFAKAYSDGEIAAVANYVIGHFGGKSGKVTAKAVAKARSQ